MEPWLWVLIGAGTAALLGFILILRWERGYFTRKGKPGAWLAVRLSLIPIALITAAVVVLPARSISGMEALAYFYIALFTIGPLLWFGLHWLAGKLAKPRLAFGESLMLALIPLTYAFVLVGVGQALAPVAWYGMRAAGEMKFGSAREAPAPTEPGVARSYRAGDGAVNTVTWTTTRDLKIERVDYIEGGQTVANAGLARRHQFCREPKAFRLVFPSGTAFPKLVVYWREGESPLQRSEIVAPTVFPEPVPFEARWEGEVFALPEPFPRATVQVISTRADGTPEYSSGGLAIFKPGESIDINCMPVGYRAPFPITGVAIFVHRPQGGDPVRLVSMRPVEGTATERAAPAEPTSATRTSTP